MERFYGQTVIVTGAAGGIGKEIVRLFATEGANLVLVDLDQSAMQEIVVELKLDMNKCLILEADVSQETDIENYVGKTVQTFGRIDVFCNNAGIEGNIHSIVDVKSEDIDRVWNVNVKGMLLGLKHVLKQMIIQKSGSIVNTASTMGLRGARKMSVYSASKHAVVGITKCAALEVAEMGIRVNAVCPAPVDTKMMLNIAESVAPHLGTEEGMNVFAGSIPVKRMAKPEEVAQLIVFLSSDEASFITGSSYIIDGGKTAG
jgi:NAD(P)-dependent dehydrogenase (short-subunit alcohol dehydrogenase family)